MKFVGIATINGERFKTIEVDATSPESAEQQVLDIMHKKYIGQINVIKVEVLDEWIKKVKYERSRL
jgi:hypothetical protein